MKAAVDFLEGDRGSRWSGVQNAEEAHQLPIAPRQVHRREVGGLPLVAQAPEKVAGVGPNLDGLGLRAELLEARLEAGKRLRLIVFEVREKTGHAESIP